MFSLTFEDQKALLLWKYLCIERSKQKWDGVCPPNLSGLFAVITSVSFLCTDSLGWTANQGSDGLHHWFNMPNLLKSCRQYPISTSQKLGPQSLTDNWCVSGETMAYRNGKWVVMFGKPAQSSVNVNLMGDEHLKAATRTTWAKHWCIKKKQ